MKKIFFASLLTGLFATGCTLDNNTLNTVNKAMNVLGQVANNNGQTGASENNSEQVSANKNSSVTGKVRTITGTISYGTGTSSIEIDDGTGFTFDSKSDVAGMIFDKCKVQDICQITGVIEGEFLTRVIKAVRVGSAQ